MVLSATSHEPLEKKSKVDCNKMVIIPGKGPYESVFLFVTTQLFILKG